MEKPFFAIIMYMKTFFLLKSKGAAIAYAVLFLGLLGIVTFLCYYRGLR